MAKFLDENLLFIYGMYVFRKHFVRKSLRVAAIVLFEESEDDGKYYKEERHKMIPLKLFATKHEGSDKSEDNERQRLLYDFKLHQREWAAVATETDAVGRHLTGVLRQRYEPREEDNGDERPVAAASGLL